MSKKTALLILLAIALIALVGVPYYLWKAPFAFVDDIPGYLEQAQAFIGKYWQGLITGVGGTITGLGYIISKLIGRKNQAIDTLNQEAERKDQAISYLSTELQKKGSIQDNVNAFTEEYGTTAFEKVQNLSSDLTKARATVEEQAKMLTLNDETIKDLKTQRTELQDECSRLLTQYQSMEEKYKQATGELPKPVP